MEGWQLPHRSSTATRCVLLTRVVLPTDKHVFALSRVLCQQGVAIHVAQHPSTLDPQGRIDLLLFLSSIWGKVAACFVLVCDAAVLSTGVTWWWVAWCILVRFSLADVGSLCASVCVGLTLTWGGRQSTLGQNALADLHSLLRVLHHGVGLTPLSEHPAPHCYYCIMCAPLHGMCCHAPHPDAVIDL